MVPQYLTHDFNFSSRRTMIHSTMQLQTLHTQKFGNEIMWTCNTWNTKMETKNIRTLHLVKEYETNLWGYCEIDFNLHLRLGCAYSTSLALLCVSYISVIKIITVMKIFNLMVSTEASRWNILNLKIYTILGYIFIMFRFPKRNTCPKFKRISATI